MAKLLVSNCTPNTDEGGIYLLDTQTTRLVRIHEHPTRGMTEAPDGIYAVGNAGDIYHLNRENWRATLKAATGLRGSHDLRWAGDGFYLVASLGNQVVRLDPDLRIIDRMQLVPDNGDVAHPNCLIQADDDLLLTIFTLSPGRREQKRRTRAWREEGKVLRLDWDAKRFDIVYEPLCQPHSLVRENGAVYCCESCAGRIVSLSLDWKTRKRLCRLRGFVRGLAIRNGSAFVGISRRRSLPFTERLARHFTERCEVVQLNTSTWKRKKTFPLPGTDVYDLIVLD